MILATTMFYLLFIPTVFLITSVVYGVMMWVDDEILFVDLMGVCLITLILVMIEVGIAQHIWG